MNRPQSEWFSLRLPSGNVIALRDGVTLNGKHLPGLHSVPPGGPVAAVKAHPTETGIYGLQNLSHLAWRAALPNGDSIEVKPGKNVRLATGTQINFGTITGEIDYARSGFAFNKRWLWIGLAIALLCLSSLAGWQIEHRLKQERLRREQIAREEENKRAAAMAAKAQAKAEAEKQQLAVQQIKEEAARLRELAAAEAAAKAAETPTPPVEATPSHDFDGTWKGEHILPRKPQYHIVQAKEKDTIIVADGTRATYILEVYTSLESEMGHWNDMLAPYNTARHMYMKFKAESQKVMTGYNSLEITLNDWELIDWKPREYPANAFLNVGSWPKMRNASFSLKNGRELTTFWTDSGEETLRLQ